MQEARIDLTDRFEGPNCIRVCAYWKRLLGHFSIARWDDVDLMDIHDVATHIAVKDAIDGGAEFRNRYWGTGLVASFGFEGSGKLLSEYYKKEDAQEIVAMMSQALAADMPSRYYGRAIYVPDRNYKHFEMGIFPLADADGAAMKLLLSYDFD